MKKCRRCSKPATLHITEIRKGEATEVHLCESCAKDYLQQADTNDDSSSEFEFDKLEDASEALDDAEDPVCPNCGITFREFRKQGRLGCPHDYVAFRNELLPLLENIHGQTQHVGKTPRQVAVSPQRQDLQHQLVRLKSQLKAAIDEEKYESAAKLRDEIHSLESQLSEKDLGPQ